MTESRAHNTMIIVTLSLRGLDKLLLFYLLFYSHILKNYSFQATHYSILPIPIILNYYSTLMAESGQNDLHTLQLIFTL